tara:strand:+ start:230 stop:490 length:261 start_codon:yes stop_codon:yes gene_type:complete
MNAHTRNVLKLKAAIEFGSEFIYTIKQCGLGPTLIISACELSSSRERAAVARKKVPSQWEGLRVIVIYSTADEEEDDDLLYDPNLV